MGLCLTFCEAYCFVSPLLSFAFALGAVVVLVGLFKVVDFVVLTIIGGIVCGSARV